MDGFKARQEEIEVGVTNELTQMVVGVMQGGKYSQRMAAEALLRSLNKTRGVKNVYETLFYKVCWWLHDNFKEHSKAYVFKSPDHLAKIISRACDLNPQSIRSCLASHPFNIPERLRPVKGKKRAVASLPPIFKGCCEPPVQAQPKFKSLMKVLDLIKAMDKLSPSPERIQISKMINELFAPELAEIEKRLLD